jgi:hypothetical protein
MQLLLAAASFVVSERNDAGLILDLVVFLPFVVAHVLNMVNACIILC